MTRIQRHPSTVTIEQSIRREFRGADKDRVIPAHDIHGPTTGGPSKGTVLLMHPGGWAIVGEQAMKTMTPQADRWNARGYTTVNVTYGTGGQSEIDCLDFYDAIDASRMGGKPTIATGASAGGHLALMVASKRDHVDGVISQGGVTNIDSLPNDDFGAMARKMFERGGTASHSPVAYADSMRAQALVAASTGDTYLLPQAVEYKAARPNKTRLMQLPKGDAPFIHSGITPQAEARFLKAEEKLEQQAFRAHYREQPPRWMSE